LLDSVDVLGSNWRVVRDVLQQTHHVLPRLFIGLFPKKKAEMPVDNLKSWSRLLTPWKIPFFR
jgi:hypothetical protein